MAAPKNPKNRWSEKPWRDALRLAVMRPADDEVKGKTKLDKMACRVVEEAISGDVQAAREIGDRLDGKVPQGITGGDGGPISMAFQWLK